VGEHGETSCFEPLIEILGKETVLKHPSGKNDPGYAGIHLYFPAHVHGSRHKGIVESSGDNPRQDPLLHVLDERLDPQR